MKVIVRTRGAQIQYSWATIPVLAQNATLCAIKGLKLASSAAYNAFIFYNAAILANSNSFFGVHKRVAHWALSLVLCTNLAHNHPRLFPAHDEIRVVLCAHAFCCCCVVFTQKLFALPHLFVYSQEVIISSVCLAGSFAVMESFNSCSNQVLVFAAVNSHISCELVYLDFNVAKYTTAVQINTAVA